MNTPIETPARKAALIREGYRLRQTFGGAKAKERAITEAKKLSKQNKVAVMGYRPPGEHQVISYDVYAKRKE